MYIYDKYSIRYQYQSSFATSDCLCKTLGILKCNYVYPNILPFQIAACDLLRQQLSSDRNKRDRKVYPNRWTQSRQTILELSAFGATLYSRVG